MLQLSTVKSQFHRLLNVLLGLGVIAQMGVGFRSVGMGQGVLGIKPDSFVVVLYRPLVFAKFTVGVTTVVLGRFILRI